MHKRSKLQCNMIKIYTCFFLLIYFFPKLLANESTLELVHVIFRHGDRTPERQLLYPTDPHINVSYPTGFGQLTKKGVEKVILLGAALRKRYKKFLGPYKAETIDARSTDYNRTKESLKLVLASLFPPKRKEKWHQIPFYYLPYQEDHVLGQTYRNCPRYRKLYIEYLETPEAQKLYENYTELKDYLRNHAKINTTSKSMFELYFNLQMEVENGLILPSWTKSVYPNPLQEVAFLEYDAKSATSNLKRLSSGFLLKKIINDTKKKSDKRKMFLYSGHEFNLIYLMQLLGIYYRHFPPYAAYLLVEIHNIKGELFVKVFYRDYSTKKLKKMRIPQCQKCSFKRFVALFKKYLPKSEKECHVT